MNRKHAKAILTKKFNHWVKSIDSIPVQELVKQNSIISGGAIVSLLTNEPVNDFDVYFTNEETTEKVARYYTDEFNKLHSPDPMPTVDVSDGRIRIRIQSAGIVGENTPDSQYQYFEGRPLEEGENYVAQSVGTILESADDLDGTQLEPSGDKKSSKYRPVFLTDNAITLSDKIQIVIRFWGNPEEIHENYDYVHCTNYWVSKTGELVLRQEALESILAKQLFYVGSLYPVCSFIRARKFIQRGWHINAGQMLKICLQISQLDLTDVTVLEDQLVGVDTAYFIQIIDYMKTCQAKDNDFQPSVPYLISIIDKIF